MIVQLDIAQTRVLVRELADTTKEAELAVARDALALMEGHQLQPWHVTDPRVVECIRFLAVICPELRDALEVAA